MLYSITSSNYNNQHSPTKKGPNVFKFKKKKPTPETDNTSWISKLKGGLTKTKKNLGDGLSQLFLGKKIIDPDLMEELETQLLLADVGIKTTDNLLEQVTDQMTRSDIKDPEKLLDVIKSCLKDMLIAEPINLRSDGNPTVILMVGVNGAGKTTSIAKIANHFKQQGKTVMLAAGDTFRAAAIEQIKVWGERNEVSVVAQKIGSDSASVIFDALQSAQAKKCDILIADTAGRLHTQGHLMNELKKIKRVIAKLDSEAPHEVMLVVDASMGQNALVQAKQFHEQIGLNSITITKLDGTAKGGIVFAIANELKLPYRFIGVGEKIDDLKPFNSSDFVDALFD
jgi:fused signal recognition particle receptor